MASMVRPQISQSLIADLVGSGSLLSGDTSYAANQVVIYTNNVALDPNTTTNDLDLPADTGLMPQAMTPDSWNTSTDDLTGDEVASASQVFFYQPSGTGGSLPLVIHGWAILGGDTGDLLYAKSLDVPVPLADTSAGLNIVPEIRILNGAIQ